MRKSIIFLLVFSSIVPLGTIAQKKANGKPCIPCEQLKQLRLPDLTILEAKSKKTDTIDGDVITVPFCRVLGRISKEINFELLLPNDWNVRFLLSGGGGFVGSIQNNLRSYVNNGFVTGGTDAGHQGSGIDASWALNNMERQVNFGKLAIHRTAAISKAIMYAYYCADPAYSYFLGCSRGGGQAMMEAQQYPEDFEGIVAGAPAFDWPAIGAKFIQISQKNYPITDQPAKNIITKDNLRLLQDLIMKQCDELDGVVDTILNDPRDCKFDFSNLPVCPDEQASPNCFTNQQLTAIKTVYSALTIQHDTVYSGFPLGSENEESGWDDWIAGTRSEQNMKSLHYYFGTSMFKYFVFNDSAWNFLNYDFSNYFKETKYAAAFLNATQSDYTGFKNRKGKMIMFHGWNDPALSAFETIRHYEEARKKDKDLASSIRLFLLPGVLHCGGGKGPDGIDWLKVLQDWVEKNKAPDRLVLTKSEKDKIVKSRPVFAYPKIAVYSGKGDPNLEKNYIEKKN